MARAAAAAPAARRRRARCEASPPGGPGARGPRHGAGAPAAPASDLPQVIWYGNAGSVRPRFGIVNLADIGAQLEAAARRTPFELLVVSGDEEAYRRDDRAAGPADELRALAPARDRRADPRAAPSRSSPTRATTSASASPPTARSARCTRGVPVVATRTPALEPFDGSVWFDDFEAGVSGYLADGERARADVARARTLIEASYSGAAVARAWSDVLSSRGYRARSVAAASFASPRRR